MEQRDNRVEQHMESTSNTQQGDRAERWPALPYEAWKDTCQTLHLWTQIVGKVRMEGKMRTIGHEEGTAEVGPQGPLPPGDGSG